MMTTATVDPWTDAMRRGDFATAWAVSDAVLRARAGRPPDPGVPRHFQNVWTGAPLAGRRVLVRCYHGLGDTVQFIRYLPRLRAIAARVIVWAQPALLPLLGASAGRLGIDRLLPLHDGGAPDADFDVDVEIMELAHVFRTTLGTVPTTVPYLYAEPAPGLKEPGRLAVGLVWRAGDWDERRSVPAAELAPLARVPGVDWHVLQRGAAALAAPRPAGLGQVSGSDRVEAVASVMRGLDLVISVDSLPAHLAGALGVPVWTLLPSLADWRWLEAPREDSPWYPTMRLFRQPAPGAWGPVVARVAAALTERAAATS